MASDEVIASSNSSQFGSIGAYISISKEMLKEVSENFIHIYADNSGDKNADLRKAFTGDLSGIQEKVNRVSKEFRDAVMADRVLKGNESRIEKTLSGGMFDASEAKSRGLSDMTGDLLTAVRRLDFYVRRLKSTT